MVDLHVATLDLLRASHIRKRSRAVEDSPAAGAKSLRCPTRAPTEGILGLAAGGTETPGWSDEIVAFALPRSSRIFLGHDEPPHQTSRHLKNLSAARRNHGRAREPQVGLDDSLKLFEEGIELLRSASAELGSAETKVQMLIEKSNGRFELREMDL